MEPGQILLIVVVGLLLLMVVVIVAKSVLVIPQAQAAVIERLGRFRTIAGAGLNFLLPFFDRVRARIDLREQVVSFPPQPVITEDNLTVSIDTVVYFQVTNPRQLYTRSPTTSSASNSSQRPRCATWSAA